MKLLHCNPSYKNILDSSVDDLDNAGIATIATQQIHKLKSAVTYKL